MTFLWTWIIPSPPYFSPPRFNERQSHSNTSSYSSPIRGYQSLIHSFTFLFLSSIICGNPTFFVNSFFAPNNSFNFVTSLLTINDFHHSTIEVDVIPSPVFFSLLQLRRLTWSSLILKSFFHLTFLVVPPCTLSLLISDSMSFFHLPLRSFCRFFVVGF